MKASKTAILKQGVIGTWTTEDGMDKLKIRKHYLVYTSDVDYVGWEFRKEW